MSDLNAAQDRTFYRVRINDGHNAVGLLVSAAGQALHPIHPVLAYRRYRRRLSLPACRRAACAGAAWEYRVYDGARENSGSVRQGIDLSLLKSGDYTHFRAAMLASSRQVISLMFS